MTSLFQIWHLCVLEPYGSIKTIIRVTAKKRDQLAPRFGTSVCWTSIATDSNSNHLSEKSVTDRPQIWDLRVLDPYSNSNHLSEKCVNDHPQIWHLCVLDPYSN